MYEKPLSAVKLKREVINETRSANPTQLPGPGNCYLRPTVTKYASWARLCFKCFTVLFSFYVLRNQGKE